MWTHRDEMTVRLQVELPGTVNITGSYRKIVPTTKH